MIKAVGFLAGQVGDAVMCSVAVRQFKQQYPHSHLTFALGKKYGHVIDLFSGLSGIDAVHVWESYQEFPSESDRSFLESFDVAFNPFPKHTRSDWYNKFHYIEETCLMLGLQKPNDLQCSLGYVPKRLSNFDKTITLSLFASGSQLEKTMRLEDMENLVKSINSLGYRCLQVGSSDEKINGAIHLQSSDIYEAIDIMASSHLHVTIDTAFSWIASAYKLPVVGLYGVNYLDMPLNRVISHNPINPNAVYLNRASVKDITVEEIITTINLF